MRDERLMVYGDLTLLHMFIDRKKAIGMTLNRAELDGISATRSEVIAARGEAITDMMGMDLTAKN